MKPGRRRQTYMIVLEEGDSCCVECHDTPTESAVVLQVMARKAWNAI
jgi:hypothetical protein